MIEVELIVTAFGDDIGVISGYLPPPLLLN